MQDILKFFTNLNEPDQLMIFAYRCDDAQGKCTEWTELDPGGNLLSAFCPLQGEAIYLISITCGLMDTQDINAMFIVEIEMRDIFVRLQTLEQWSRILQKSLTIPVFEGGMKFRIKRDDLQCGFQFTATRLQGSLVVVLQVSNLTREFLLILCFFVEDGTDDKYRQCHTSH